MRGSAPLAALLVASVAGCGSHVPGPTITTLGYPTPPMAPRTAGHPFDAGNGRVIVLSPTLLVSVGFGPVDPNKPLDMQPNVPHEISAYISGYDEVASAFQRHLLALGFTPVDSAALLGALRDPSVVARIQARAQQSGGDLTLLDLAVELGPLVNADLALLVRDSRVGFADEPVAVHNGPPGCRVARVQPLSVAIDSALVRTAGGDVVWSGENRTLAGDLFPEPVAFPRGPYRSQHSRSYGELRIIGQDDLSDCGTTIFGGLTCVEWGDPSGGCMRETEPHDAEAIARVVDACVDGLVESIRPLVAATSGGEAAAP